MDYKLLQKAILDRLGSQFTISLIIVFAVMNWELLFNMVDMSITIQDKIALVKATEFSIWQELGWTFILIVVFQLCTWVAKIIGVLFNDSLWSWTLMKLKFVSKYKTYEEYQLVVKAHDELKEISDKYVSEIKSLEHNTTNDKAKISGYVDNITKLEEEVKQANKKTDTVIENLDNYGRATSHLISGIRSINPGQIPEGAKVSFTNATELLARASESDHNEFKRKLKGYIIG